MTAPATAVPTIYRGIERLCDRKGTYGRGGVTKAS